MDTDNLDRLFTIISLLDRFKERMMHAEKRSRRTSMESRRALTMSKRLSRGSQELLGFGFKESGRYSSDSGLISMVSGTRSQGGVEYARRKSVFFGRESAEDTEAPEFEFKKMIHRSMSRAISRRMRSKVDDFDEGYSSTNLRKLARQSSETDISGSFGLQRGELLDEAGKSPVLIPSDTTGDSLESDRATDSPESFEVEDLRSSIEGFLDHKRGSGALTDPGSYDFDAAGFDSKKLSPPKSAQIKKRRITIGATVTTHFQLGSSMSSDIGNLGVSSSMESEAAAGERMMKDLGEDFAMHVAATSPDVLEKLLNRIIDYVKFDLDRLLDELLSNAQQEQMKLQRLEQHLQIAITKAENQEVEAAELQVEVNDLRVSKEQSQKKIAVMKKRQEELEKETAELMRKEVELEAQRQEALKLQKSKAEEVEQLKRAIRAKDDEVDEARMSVEREMSWKPSRVSSVVSEVDQGFGTIRFPTLIRPPIASFEIIRREQSLTTDSSKDSPSLVPSLLMDDMATRFGDMEAQLNKDASTIANLELQIQELKGELENAMKEKDALEKYLQELDVERLLEEAAKWEKQLKEAEEMIDSLKAAEKDALDEAQTEREAAIQIREAYLQISDELARLKEQIEEAQDKQVAEIEGIEERWNTQYQVLQGKYSTVVEELKNAQTQLNEVLELNKNLGERLQDSEGINQTNKEIIVGMRNELTEMTELKENVLSLTVQVEAKDEAISQLKQELTSLSSRPPVADAAAEEEIKKCQERIESLIIAERVAVEQVEKEKALANEMRENLDQAVEVLTQLKEQFERETNEIRATQLEEIKAVEDEWNKKNQALQQKYDTLLTESSDAREKLMEELERSKGQEKRLKDTESTYESNKQMIERLQNELVRSNGEKTELEQKLSDKEQEKSRAIADAEKLLEDQEKARMYYDEEIMRLTTEGEVKDEAIVQLKDEIKKLSSVLGDKAADAQLTRRYEEEMKRMTAANNELSRELEDAKMQINKLTEEFCEGNRAFFEQELQKQRTLASELTHAFHTTMTELRDDLEKRSTEHQNLSETCKILLEEKQKAAESAKEIESELLVLQNQFQEFQRERKATEEQLTETLKKLEGRESMSVEVNNRIKELQHTIDGARTAIDVTKHELRDDILRGFWRDRLDQLQKENGQLKSKLSTMMSLLTHLNEGLIDIREATRPPPCVQFILRSCCPTQPNKAAFHKTGHCY